MVRPAENIRKDLDVLRGATASLAEEFGQVYATYLTVLGHALRRQVIMATYHLCTQVYPDEFLALSVSDRARLQQDVQSLGRKSQSWLQQLLEPEQINEEAEPSSRLDAQDMSRLEAALVALTQPTKSPDRLGEGDREAEADDTAAATSSPPGDGPEPPAGEQPAEPEPSTSVASNSDDASDGETPETAGGLDPKQLMQSVLLAAMAGEIEDTFGGRPFVGDPLTPTLVAKHHLILERMIREVLQRASRHANRVLRKAKILPDLPEALLEMAAEADVGVPKGRSVPNVLNVMVAMSGEAAAEFEHRDLDEDDDQDEDESEDDDEARSANMTHLAAIHLRLADLEFGDVQAALWRSKLRTLVGRLRKLGKQYQQAERELAIAQAEQAWRAVWSDDSSR